MSEQNEVGIQYIVGLIYPPVPRLDQQIRIGFITSESTLMLNSKSNWYPNRNKHLVSNNRFSFVYRPLSHSLIDTFLLIKLECCSLWLA